MPVGGFLPLASSVLSSEPDIETPRQPLKPILNQAALGGTASRLRPRQLSTFSFSALAAGSGKRARLGDEAYAAMSSSTPALRKWSLPPHSQAMVERALLQPVRINPAAAKTPALTFEEIESILSPPSHRSDIILPSSSASNLAEHSSTWGSENTSSLDFWLFDDLVSPEIIDTAAAAAPPFLGDATLVRSSSILPEKPPSARQNRRPAQSPFVPVSDLFQRKSDTTPRDTTIQVKGMMADSASGPPPPQFCLVIPSRQSLASEKSITPNFSRKIVSKAAQSRDRARNERQQYSRFLRRLCADGMSLRLIVAARTCASLLTFIIVTLIVLEIVEESDEDDEDDIFDILGHGSNESDDGAGESCLQQEPKGIPNRELLELFAADAEVRSRVEPEG